MKALPHTGQGAFTLTITCVTTTELSRASLIAQLVKKLPAAQETRVRSLSREDPLEEGMATPSSVPAWRTPRTEEPAGYMALGSQDSDTSLEPPEPPLNHRPGSSCLLGTTVCSGGRRCPTLMGSMRLGCCCCNFCEGLA